ncbi:MAG: helix-turn-helix transcriptional regulator [Alphaproteobacteria bacterium]|nr:helix-turn-helix transcriptional regulator [Alphaproteobacteria bacterium]
MITPEQIRAARAMLDWSTAELAELTGLTVGSINKIERGHVDPQQTTLKKIKAAFERYGVEFLSESGLKKKNNLIEIFRGPAAGSDLARDIFETLQDTGGEVLIAYADEKKAAESLGEDYLAEQVRQRTAANIYHRILCFERNYYRIPGVPAEHYRILPDKYFSACPFFIYGSKLALYSTVIPQTVILIDDARFAESARRLFEFAWELAGGKYPKGKLYTVSDQRPLRRLT